jgi:hypothetical protein
MKAMKRYPFSLLAVLLCSAAAIACNVPVFRYALERWPADLYEVAVLHEGPLSQEDGERLELLRQSQSESTVSANFKVRSIDIGDTQDQQLIGLWKEHSSKGQPLMAVLYPRNAREVPDRLVSTGPFSDQAIKRLVDSPVRQEIAKKLLDGDSAVWIFVPSGHSDRDAAALKMLKEQVKRNQDELELPPQDEIEADEFFREETPIELRIGFSIVTLNREDPHEQYLLQLLMGSEPDLETLDEPMAFPVIGRGRVLYALVGKGIFRDTIAMASSFVVGPCSCQVKDQNPGFGLLLAVDWDAELGGSVISDPPPAKSSKPILLEIPPGN